MTQLFVAMMGTSFEGEDTTTLLRMVDASLDSNFTVTVWTCGGATLLTARHLGLTRPRNLLELGTSRTDHEYPTTAALIHSLIQKSDRRLRWLVCRHCMQERGALDHIEGVIVTSPLRYLQTMQAADVSLVMGRK